MRGDQEKGFESLPIPQEALSIQLDQDLPEIRSVWDKRAAILN